MQELGRGFQDIRVAPTYIQQGNGRGAAQSYNHKEQDSAYHLNEAKSESS